MNQLIKLDTTLFGLIKSTLSGNDLPMPFSQEVYLMDTHIAGTSFRNLEDIEPGLSKGNLLCFKREPNNTDDSMAITIQDEDGNKLGYVPKDKNEIIARLMDAGKLLIGKLEEKQWCGTWLTLDISVSMREL